MRRSPRSLLRLLQRRLGLESQNQGHLKRFSQKGWDESPQRKSSPILRISLSLRLSKPKLPVVLIVREGLSEGDTNRARAALRSRNIKRAMLDALATSSEKRVTRGETTRCRCSQTTYSDS